MVYHTLRSYQASSDATRHFLGSTRSSPEAQCTSFVRVWTVVKTTTRLSCDVHGSHVKIPCLTQISSSADRWYCSIIHDITAGQGRNREEYRSVQIRVFFSYFNFREVHLPRFIVRSKSSCLPTLPSAWRVRPSRTALRYWINCRMYESFRLFFKESLNGGVTTSTPVSSRGHEKVLWLAPTPQTLWSHKCLLTLWRVTTTIVVVPHC